MRTETIKFKSYPRRRTISQASDLNKRIFRATMTSLGFVALCYLVFLLVMVWNIIDRKNAESRIRVLGAEVNNLELEYLQASGKVDLNLAYSMGFKETESKEFATRKALGSLTTLPNEL